MVSEILDQLAACGEATPTHVVINCGVGGFAAAICGYLWDALGDDRPMFITAEPGVADPVLRSGAEGRIVACPGIGWPARNPSSANAAAHAVVRSLFEKNARTADSFHRFFFRVSFFPKLLD